jgi:hypothetical protein
MSFTSDEEYGQLLRRAMRAEADSVVPSPDGLEIIRARIEQRGLRGLFWWRVSASLAGAVLVAGTVVMLVPDLRTQVVQSTGTTQTTAESTRLPDTSSIKRPPAAAPPQGTVSSSPPRVRDTPTPASKAPSPSPSPSSRPDPCVSSDADRTEAAEPEPSPADSCPADEPSSSKPAETPSASPTPSPSPDVCSGDACSSPDPDEGSGSADPQPPDETHAVE